MYKIVNCFLPYYLISRYPRFWSLIPWDYPSLIWQFLFFLASTQKFKYNTIFSKIILTYYNCSFILYHRVHTNTISID